MRACSFKIDYGRGMRRLPLLLALLMLLPAATARGATAQEAIAMLNGAGALHDALHALAESGSEPATLHRFLASLPKIGEPAAA